MTWQMAHPSVLWGFAALPVVWWSLRGLRQTLPPQRFAGVVVTRHLLLATLLLGLSGIGAVRHLPREPLIVYLVDRSASIDAAERQWQRQQLERLEAGLSERAERVLMLFGGRAQTLQRWSTHQAASAGALAKATDISPPEAITAQATNLQGALLTSFSSTAEDRAKRIVVLSDGLQTEGDALQAAGVARLERIPIFTYQPPTAGYEDVGITKILVPQTARRAAPVAIRVGLENSAERPLRTRVVVNDQDGRTLFDQRMELPPGKHLVEVPARPETLGGYQVTARVEAEGDRVPGNNTRAAAFEVIGPPQVLFIGGTPGQAPYVAQVLQQRQIDVDVKDLSGIPADLSQLLTYDAVVFSNVPRTALDAAQVELLTQYVQQFGGGLVMIGSGGDLAEEARATTPLDPLLPAWLTLDAPQEKQTQTRLSLALLTDRSSSMSGARLSLMKHGAVELVKQLEPTDMIGVIAFDTRPFIIVPLQAVGAARSTIVERLVRIKAGGGTHFLPALVEAKMQLGASGAMLKHIILLSDGNTMDPNSPFYQRFIEECRDEHVSVSTMAMGAMFVNVELMRYIAHQTGGRFYHIKDERDLPQLIVADTQRVLARSPFAEGWFRPRITQPHEMTQGLREEELPPLKGYLVVEAKPGATTSLMVPADTDEDERERQDPLLVHWPAGLGRVTMFASDAESRWSSPWIHWDRYQKFWAQVLTWTMRRASLRELLARVEYVGGAPMLVVHTPPAAKPVEQFRVRLVREGESAGSELTLSRVTPTQWRASLEGVTPGLYQAIFLQTAQGQLTGEARRWIDISSRSLGLATETPVAPPDAGLLARLAERSGGAVEATPETIIGQNPTQRVVDRWERWLIPLFLLLFLIDVALRGETML